jgi:3-hydroxyisobutyrate dehydrogenase
MFTIELVDKDLGYMQEAAVQRDSLPIATTARRVFQRSIERGYGRDNMTSVIRLYASRNHLSSE